MHHSSRRYRSGFCICLLRGSNNTEPEAVATGRIAHWKSSMNGITRCRLRSVGVECECITRPVATALGSVFVYCVGRIIRNRKR
jgi:hypothetical protein